MLDVQHIEFDRVAIMLSGLEIRYNLLAKWEKGRGRPNGVLVGVNNPENA